MVFIDCIVYFVSLAFLISVFVFSDILHTIRISNGHYFREIELRQRRKEIRQKELLAKKQKRLARKLRTNISKIS